MKGPPGDGEGNGEGDGEVSSEGDGEEEALALDDRFGELVFVGEFDDEIMGEDEFDRELLAVPVPDIARGTNLIEPSLSCEEGPTFGRELERAVRIERLRTRNILSCCGSLTRTGAQTCLFRSKR